jgi:archaellum component FlaC
MSKNTKSRFSCVASQSSDLKTVNDPIAKLDAKMEDILNSLSFMSKQFNGFNNKLKSSLVEMKLLRNDYEKIKIENPRLSNEILEIK